MKFPPDKFQQPILDSISSGAPNNNLFINAVAGSGKSTTLEMVCEELKKQKLRVLLLAFNSHIAKAAAEKIKGVDVMTSHARGSRALQKVKKTKSPDIWKYSNICDEIAQENWSKQADRYKARRELKDIASFCFLSGIDVSQPSSIAECIDTYGLDCFDERLISLVPQVKSEGLRSFNKYGEIDFMDQIFLPIELGIEFDKYDVVLADEAQDFNYLQIMISSLSISSKGSGLWVADPFQSMYGFAGALPDSCDKIIQMNNCKEMPLSYCYRCPTSHLDRARKLVPHIENSPFAKEGEFIVRQRKKFSNLITPESMVLCRFTAPLISACIELVTQRKPAYVVGQEIHKGLERIIDATSEQEGFKLVNFSEHLGFEKEEELDLLRKRKNCENKAAATEDKFNAIDTCFRQFKPDTIQDFKKDLKELFSPKRGAVTLSTIHRSKGLEFNDVFVLEDGKNSMPVNFPNSLPWEQQQERNIKYVAYTRSKQRLVKVIDNKEGNSVE